MSLFKHLGPLLIAGTVLCACSEQLPSDPVSNQSQSPVLVMVNGEAITENDVEFAIQKTFSEAELMLADEGLRKKVLESLVASRAMRHAASLELTLDERERIAQRVASYEEELYVREYLRMHTTPQPVTTAMVEAYYNKHPEYFGADDVLELSVLTMSADADEANKQWFLQHVGKLKKVDDWAEQAAQWQSKQLTFSRQRVEQSKLPPKLKASVPALAIGSVSSVVVDNGQMQVVKVTERQSIPPKPLAEVSAEIRKRLAPVNVKRAVKTASEKAVETAVIEWITPR
ncbi:peptidyl-prolyl cis-trans isomerase [Corallincola platygyrae]|uniref:Peptidyl-prolyl cis-trans isomerase n=1 Tax=Corallincola platygyrae TaxID=1193278 RepID=A0ABW4XLI1_9GAMM